MKTILLLYFANLILDYSLQGKLLAELKIKSNYFLFVHCAIWSIGLSLLLIPLGLFAIWKLIMLILGHYIIDYWKCRELYKPFLKDKQALYIDQILHVGQVLLCLI